MKILFPIYFALIFSCCISQAQTKIGDVILSNAFNAGKESLILNGAGIREKYWIDMYAAGLYLSTKSKDASAIVADNSTMAIKIHIISSLITSSKMSDAVEEGFKKSTGNSAPYKDKIEQFRKAFAEPIRVSDEFDIVYSAGKISIYKNSILKAEIEGLDFKKAVFGIWLGPNPADENLKKGMLGEAD